MNVDRAVTEARAADEAVGRGAAVGPLHGVPCTVKDAIETAGLRSTSSAPKLAEHVPSADPPAVARLRAAGAIVFGKTNVPVWAGDMQSYNELFGATSNPWALEHGAGGSSGGAAAAVAAGFTGFDLATDIGGSIRIPAHLCGVFGLRSSYGVIPQGGYLAGVWRGKAGLDNNVFGPIVRHPDDLELLLDVLAGADHDESVGWTLRLPPPSSDKLADYCIGLWLDDPYCPVDRECLGLIRDTVDQIIGAGARIGDEHPPVDFSESFDTYWTLLMSANGLDADDRRRRHREVWLSWFASGFDALLCPVLATAAYPHEHSGDYSSRYVTVNGQRRSHPDIARWTGLVGALGMPSAAVPIGRTAEGLPVGVQVIAPYLRDRDAVRIAGLIAEVAGGYARPPGF